MSDSNVLGAFNFALGVGSVMMTSANATGAPSASNNIAAMDSAVQQLANALEERRAQLQAAERELEQAKALLSHTMANLNTFRNENDGSPSEFYRKKIKEMEVLVIRRYESLSEVRTRWMRAMTAFRDAQDDYRHARAERRAAIDGALLAGTPGTPAGHTATYPPQAAPGVHADNSFNGNRLSIHNHNNAPASSFDWIGLIKNAIRIATCGHFF